MPLAAIIVFTVLAHTAFNGGRLTIALSALAQGASPASVGVLLSLFAALPMLLAVPAGRFVDRIGVRGPLLVSTIALAVSAALPGIHAGMTPLYVASAAMGMSFMVFHICVQHLVGVSSAPEVRQANFGWLSLGFSISNVAGPTIAGISIDLLGHASAFLIEAALALCALMMIVGARERLPHTVHDALASPPSSTMELLRDRELRRVFLVTALLASAWDLFAFAMPIHGTALGLSATTIGFILASFAFATFVIRLALPWVGNRVREWTMITGTFLVAGTAYTLFPMVDQVSLMVPIAFLLGLGLGATQPSILALTFAKTPAGRRAEALGVRSTVMNTSHTFLPLTFGGAGTALGMGPLFWTMAAFLFVGGIYASRLRRN